MKKRKNVAKNEKKQKNDAHKLDMVDIIPIMTCMMASLAVEMAAVESKWTILLKNGQNLVFFTYFS